LKGGEKILGKEWGTIQRGGKGKKQARGNEKNITFGVGVPCTAGGGSVLLARTEKEKKKFKNQTGDAERGRTREPKKKLKTKGNITTLLNK